ncbi:MAG: hypothetical protein A2Z95_04430 [Gallionellales bacterium GWA2_60_18]|nr:MAG: hypothetical protein A2Z95_04430 [Gallionellales bacterium GWA2_60_18]
MASARKVKSPAPQDLNQLVWLFNAGHWANCEVGARALTARFPAHGFGWKVLGLVLMQQGRAAEALPAMRKTAALFPGEADAHYNLGVALMAEGLVVEAEASYRRALRLNLGYTEAHGNLGNVLSEQKRHAEAEVAYRHALELAPQVPEAHNNLGNVLKEQGRHEEAEASYRRALELNPHYAEAYNNLGVVIMEQGRHLEAEASFRSALGIDPGYVEAISNMGIAFSEQGCHAEAKACHQQALKLKPDYVEAHLNLGHVLRSQGMRTEAEASYRRALALKPDYALTMLALGKLLGDSGRFAEAEAQFLQALMVEPEMPEAWAELVGTRKMTTVDTAWMDTAESIVAKGVTTRQESALRYAMGKYGDDVKDYDRAFIHYQRANELEKTFSQSYDRQQRREMTERLMRDYPAERVSEVRPGASASERPLFVVGMPRSGTSLIEQILASHPAVFGVGELHFWGDTARKIGQDITPEHLDEAALRRIADECLQELASHSTDAVRVADKMPGNFAHLGLIHAVFPNARILHTRRNPIDTCLSIYFQNFSASHDYANDLKDLAHYYREYHRLMAHWRAVLPPEVFLDVPYEALVEDQEGWSRRIIEFVGLEWDDACLNFHETERKVGTASNWQVRQKIYSSSKERWRNYEKHVGPLLGLLELYQPVIAR